MPSSRRKLDFRDYIAMVVLAVWVVVVIASIFTQEYQPVYAISPLLMVVLGFYFGIRALQAFKEPEKE